MAIVLIVLKILRVAEMVMVLIVLRVLKVVEMVTQVVLVVMMVVVKPQSQLTTLQHQHEGRLLVSLPIWVGPQLHFADKRRVERSALVNYPPGIHASALL